MKPKIVVRRTTVEISNKRKLYKYDFDLEETAPTSKATESTRESESAKGNLSKEGSKDE